LNLDHEDLRAIEATMATPGWRLLVKAFGELREIAVRVVFNLDTPSDVRDQAIAVARGQDQVLGWFERQLEDSRETRRTA
jgi:hypothetical protein